MKKLLMNLVLLLGVMFVVSLQPVFMLSSLIMITVFYSFFIYNFLGTFWFSYILLMVMMSGVLVVFTYMVVMSPNEGFEVYNMIIILLFFMSVIMMFDLWMWMDMSLISMNLWITYVGMLNLFFISFLMAIMLMVVIMSYLSEGAFRVS